MTKQLRVGFIGTGIFAKDTHLPAFQKKPNQYKPIAAFNRTKAKAEDFASAAGISSENVHDSLDEIISNPNVDFLDILLPVEYNLEVLTKAVEHKKPVIIEKPIAANIEQAKEIVKLDESTTVPIIIAEQWLYLNAITEINKRLPKIGEIVSFTYRATQPFERHGKYVNTSWRQKPKHIGGYLSDGGVHQLAVLTGVLGEVESVSALTKQLRPESGTVDTLFSTLKTKNGAIGTFIYGEKFGAVEKHGSFNIFGLNGSISLDFSDGKPKTLKLIVGPTGEEIQEEETIEVIESDPQGIDDEFEGAYQAIVQNDKSLIKSKPRVAFHHLAVIDAALKSAEKNGDHFKVEHP
ncbi:hypothetical protein WICMUC_002261 [Wickerhamomyces mucosus]|uniref:Gfo/Idh/MocA-like oxidoreductase N-terminal domain-containing protein n=1 Tax=Wickerhamomyces mucosus TaxID=1378264 RepID=A0A9P8TET6_9ASCO|nr:hypothetical protein WICMUC_002261 [Wickerhamomyces mucosus]